MRIYKENLLKKIDIYSISYTLIVIGLLFFNLVIKTQIAQAQGEQTPANQCSNGLKPCTESFSEECQINEPGDGIRECFKNGCSPDGKGGPQCSWGPGSYCDECKPKGSGDNDDNDTCTTAQNSEAGHCVKGADGRCWPGCRAGWQRADSDESSDTKECLRVTCNCGNNIYCCREKTSPPPEEPPKEPPKEPPPPPPEEPTETPTPTPTIIIESENPNEDRISNEKNNESNNNSEETSYTWVCLKSEYWEGTEGSPTYTDHKLILYGDLPHTGDKSIYIAGCIETEDNYYCTTGDPEKDQVLRISKLSTHDFKLIQPDSNPFNFNGNQITKEGDNKVIVYSKTDQTYTHKFYAVYQTPADGVDGEGRTPQLGGIQFTQGTESECIKIIWDPKGKVLYYPSLQAAKNIKITLLDKNKKKVKFPTIKSYLLTDKDGKFDFFAPDGIYYLKIDLDKNYKLVEKPNSNILSKLPKNAVIYTKNMKLDTQKLKDKELIILIKKKSLIERIIDFIKNRK